MSKPSNPAIMQVLGKSSSIFDVDQVRTLRSQAGGNSTTSFSCEPTHQDDKAMRDRRAAILEPTYRLEPRVKIKPKVIKSIIESVLEDRLTGTGTTDMLSIGYGCCWWVFLTNWYTAYVMNSQVYSLIVVNSKWSWSESLLTKKLFALYFLLSLLSGKAYSPQWAGDESKQICNEIQRLVKRQRFDRWVKTRCWQRVSITQLNFW